MIICLIMWSKIVDKNIWKLVGSFPYFMDSGQFLSIYEQLTLGRGGGEVTGYL